MVITHPKRRFQQVAFDIQTITPRNKKGNVEVLAMIDVFTRYMRAVPIRDENAGTIAEVLLNEWISIFGYKNYIESDGGTSVAADVVTSLTETLGIARTQTYPLHPQADGSVKCWNRTLARDLASFMTTGMSDWDEDVALACFRYSTGLCTATGMSPYKAMFGAEPFEAWNWTWIVSLESQKVWGRDWRYSTSSY